MANPLACNKDGEFDVKFDLTHFKGGGMLVPHQILNQPFVRSDPFGSFAIRDSSSLNNRLVIPHIINDADKSMIENRERGEENLL